ncbi:hypothetical protein CCHOA_08495 [Corynebacterium choanae]|uniref:Uncharacterized protein n=1 Tax=Corynebacterium choanae TaxID=1862358 RepID=A0A3G6JAX1_9CORY|nr:hypothetical protein CCHOA_08495 [Corynebacterium choanae]
MFGWGWQVVHHCPNSTWWRRPRQPVAQQTVEGYGFVAMKFRPPQPERLPGHAAEFVGLAVPWISGLLSKCVPPEGSPTQPAAIAETPYSLRFVPAHRVELAAPESPWSPVRTGQLVDLCWQQQMQQSRRAAIHQR